MLDFIHFLIGILITSAVLYVVMNFIWAMLWPDTEDGQKAAYFVDKLVGKAQRVMPVLCLISLVLYLIAFILMTLS